MREPSYDSHRTRGCGLCNDIAKKRRPIGRLDSLCEVVSVNFVDHHALSGVDQIGAIFAVDVAVVAQ